jgi:hypothetical protein
VKPINILRMRNAGGSWLPTSTSSLVFLLDHTTAKTNAGSSQCSNWADRTTNGYAGSQSTAGDRPLIVAAGLNGYDTLNFVSTDTLVLPSAVGNTSNNTAAMWAFCVYKNGTSSSAIRNLFGISTNTTATIRFGMQASRTGATDRATLGARRADADAFVSLSATTSASTNWTMAAIRLDVPNRDGFVDVNGVLGDASNLTFTTAGTNIAATNPADVAVIGSGVGGSGNPFNGQIAVIAYGAGALPSTGVMNQWFGYYAHQLGLASLLDVSHPYKSAPP